MKLRDYQQECLEILKKNKKKQLIQLPTGSGKTFIFLKYLRENSKSALIVVPTLDLQNQIYENALNFYHTEEIHLKKREKNLKKAVIYIIVANSLSSEKTKEFFLYNPIDHIIIDEAHRSFSKYYLDFFSFYEKINPYFKLIGFTATPERLDRKNLLNIFNEISYSKNIYDLIVEGYLCDIKAYRVKTKIELKTYGKSNDFTPIDLKILDNYSRNKLIYDTYFENCVGKKTLIFCLSIEHCEKLADYLRKEKGVKAHHIHGNQPLHHRKKILEKFKSGEIEVLTNCQLLTEGFDEPSIECLIIARPTRSKSLYCQMVGRGTRLYPGKNYCELYELTDNCHKICTFNVAADEKKDENFIREYRQGITLTELRKEISQISLSNYILEKNEIKVINDFKLFLENEGLLNIQKKKLQENNIQFINPINLIQASFLLFLNKLKKKYGYN